MNDKAIQTVIILGTGGNSVEILDAIHAVNSITPSYQPMGFLDDNSDLAGQFINGTPVLGTLERAMEFRFALFVNGIGSQHNYWQREMITRRIGVPLERYVTIIHPRASVSETASIGRGSVILQNTSICHSAVIGNHVLILPNTVVSHDTVIEDHVCIAAGVCISGGSRIGASSYIGLNASIRERLHIGSRALVGMGAVVIDNVADETVVVGCPAKFLRACSLPVRTT